jgi:hypothetical protein
MMNEVLEPDLKIKSNLPKKPYILHDKGCSMAIRALESAIRANPRYIQHNQPNSLAFMTFDLDYERAIVAHEWEDVLQPSFYVVDSEKTTAHCVYMLENPVHRNEHSKDAPQRLYATIEQLYGKVLKADSGYSGLVMKNPFYSEHHLYLPEETLTLCSLTDMAEYCDFDAFNARKVSKRKAVLSDAYSESRNVAVFDLVRKWAYSSIREHWGGSFDNWHSECIKRVEKAWEGVKINYEASLHEYLISERRATAKSIAKWTWKNITQSSFASFVALTHLPHQQAKRGIKSGQARLALSEDKREQARELRAQGVKVVDIAKMLDVHRNTVNNWLSKNAQ